MAYDDTPDTNNCPRVLNETQSTPTVLPSTLCERVEFCLLRQQVLASWLKQNPDLSSFVRFIDYFSMAAAGPAAAAVVPYVHPISDAVVLKAHKEKHEGASDETWPPFVLQAENYAEEIDALYCLTCDPITRQNQINAMGYPAARVVIDQSRIFNFLVHATAHYARVEIADVGRGTIDAGSRLFDATATNPTMLLLVSARRRL
mmetsp:Transcript_62039/g.128372  ORF Transcript_62039/g.128372 Transcript_62039/m.128372 type:complete len:203 (-) Transcript_62039:447-1055(-)